MRGASVRAVSAPPGHQTVQMTIREAHLSAGVPDQEISGARSAGRRRCLARSSRLRGEDGNLPGRADSQERRLAEFLGKMARPAGLEPAASWFVGHQRSKPDRSRPQKTWVGCHATWRLALARMRVFRKFLQVLASAIASSVAAACHWRSPHVSRLARYHRSLSRRSSTFASTPDSIPSAMARSWFLSSSS